MDLWAFVAREDNLLQGVGRTSITGTVFPFTQKRRIRLQSLHTPSESFARGARIVGSYHWTVHFPTSCGVGPWSWECQWGGIGFAFDDVDVIEEGTLIAVIGHQRLQGEESIIQEKRKAVLTYILIAAQ
ncbi:hypothetical protein SLEP1_g11547 [Rubroshorea leprosula]|nr:hypothetical protein SLEP1_g11547 [Rubroshorea leprosula]